MDVLEVIRRERGGIGSEEGEEREEGVVSSLRSRSKRALLQ